MHFITNLCFSSLYAWQELLPSMKDVYGVELEDPKRENMKDYERYCLHMPCGDIPRCLWQTGSLTETKDERTERWMGNRPSTQINWLFVCPIGSLKRALKSLAMRVVWVSWSCVTHFIHFNLKKTATNWVKYESNHWKQWRNIYITQQIQIMARMDRGAEKGGFQNCLAKQVFKVDYCCL